MNTRFVGYYSIQNIAYIILSVCLSVSILFVYPFVHLCPLLFWSEHAVEVCVPACQETIESVVSNDGVS